MKFTWPYCLITTPYVLLKNLLLWIYFFIVFMYIFFTFVSLIYLLILCRKHPFECDVKVKWVVCPLFLYIAFKCWKALMLKIFPFNFFFFFYYFIFFELIPLKAFTFPPGDQNAENLNSSESNGESARLVLGNWKGRNNGIELVREEGLNAAEFKNDKEQSDEKLFF